jgi:Flp pilus assembly secretin CpaC
MTRLRIALVHLLVATGLVLGLDQLVAAATDPALLRMEVTIGKSQVLNLQEAFTRVSVTNPAIADVFV